ncbi:collagen-like repeat preface domain-containing protein, partial [Bacillus cereus]|uniref:collagen-like repeat preface domain-containing protein n=1 Tax=Bacillus cereus TaxID=1396 RepID=UPI000BECFA43
MTPTIPVTPAQETILLNFFAALQQDATTFINDPSAINNQNLQTFLISFNNYFLANYNSFPYNSVAYSQFLMQDTLQPLNQNPIQLEQVSQLLQELCAALQQFVQELILPPTTYNILLTNLANTIQMIGVQPVSAQYPINANSAVAFVNLYTALQNNVTLFFANPSPANNQNLQNLMSAFFSYLQTFPIPSYVLYTQFLSNQVTQTLNASPVSLGKVSQLLQQFCAELANLMERLLMDPTSYQQLVTTLGNTVNVLSAQPVGATGAQGLQG